MYILLVQMCMCGRGKNNNVEKISRQGVKFVLHFIFIHTCTMGIHSFIHFSIDIEYICIINLCGRRHNEMIFKQTHFFAWLRTTNCIYVYSNEITSLGASFKTTSPLRRSAISILGVFSFCLRRPLNILFHFYLIFFFFISKLKIRI